MAATEAVNPRSVGIDEKSAVEICRIMHEADLEAWNALEAAIDDIAKVVDFVADAFRRGRRLVYLGAGSSGRLGVIDASECPPTFGVDADLVQAYIAGGDEALRRSIEGAEDSAADGSRQIESLALTEGDVVCGIAASGTTPYVRGALVTARRRGCVTVLLTSNPQWSQHGDPSDVDVAIVLGVGPEILAGSSRLKAGTAAKMALNMITTGAMIRWGKVYDNLMVDLTAVNEKAARTRLATRPKDRRGRARGGREAAARERVERQGGGGDGAVPRVRGRGERAVGEGRGEFEAGVGRWVRGGVGIGAGAVSDVRIRIGIRIRIR